MDQDRNTQPPSIAKKSINNGIRKANATSDKAAPTRTPTGKIDIKKFDATKPDLNKSASAVNSVTLARLANARIDDIDKNYASVTITDCPGDTPRCDGAVLTLAVKDALRPELKAFHKGDHVRIDVADEKELRSIGIRDVPVSVGFRCLVLGIAFASCFLMTALITSGHPLRLIIGQDGRYSNSKFQLAIWFGMVIATYLATVYLRASQAGWEFLGGVNIPQNLFLLSGMSALTFGGAKGVTTAKVNAAVAAGNPDPKPVQPAGHENFWKDLIQNDVGGFDLGDFQMLVVTLLAVGMYLTFTFNFLSSIGSWKALDLPNVDTTILAAFGLGHGAYLTKKAVGNVATS